MIRKSNFDQRAKEFFTRLREKIDFGVRMKTVEFRRFTRQFLVDVGVKPFVIQRWWQRKLGGQLQIAFEHRRIQIRFQIIPTETSIPIVGDVTAVHDLPENVSKIFPRNFRVRFQIVSQHVDANLQVAGRKRIFSTDERRSEHSEIEDEDRTDSNRSGRISCVEKQRRESNTRRRESV